VARYDIPEGSYRCAGARVAVVAARFNAAIVERLLEGALETLERHGLPAAAVDVARVPGAFEIPLAAQRLAASRRYQAVIALGAVIRGDTPHFEYVAGECARGLMQVGLESGVPVLFGVLTVEDLAQAEARAGRDQGNKGREAALAALEMISLLRALER